MLRFFRSIRQKLIEGKNVRSYFIYAIGEILLVMVGILLALQVNNWNQERKDRQVERKLLQELIENLQINETRFINSIEDERITAQSIEYLVESLENQWPYNDTMDYHYGRSDFAADMVLSTTAFEAIKSKGFDIIASDETRKALIDLFDAEYGVLLANTIRLEDQFWPSSALPLFHKHFRINDIRHGISDKLFLAKPVNYEALLADEKFHNMIKHRGSFRYSSIEFKKVALEKTIKLKEQIIEYLQ